MSHSSSNSKNRKSNFSNNPPSGSQSSSNTGQNSTYKPQAPPSGQSSYSSRSGNKSHGQTTESFDPMPPSKSGNEKNLPSNHNFQYNNNNQTNNGYAPFYPQPPIQIEQNITNHQNQSTSMSFQQPLYPNYSNANPEYQNVSNFPNYGQDLLPGYLNFNTSGTQMLEEKPELPSSKPENKIKRSRREPEGIVEEIEVIHKKNKTENVYGDRLQVLSNELAKVKEFEVQTIKALFNTPSFSASTIKGRKEWENLISQRNAVSNIPLLSTNLLAEAALLNVPHEALRGVLTDLLNNKPQEASQLDVAKKDLIEKVQKENEDEKREGRIEEEKEELCKVIHVSTQPFYQANPTIKEYEDKLDKMENVLRDKKSKIRESTKKVGAAKFELDIALAKWEIANRRIKDMEAPDT